MRSAPFMTAVALLTLATAAVLAQQPAGPDRTWAFPVTNGAVPAEEPGPKSLPGSTRTYTPEQIDDLRNPPDWYPDDHAPPPSIVTKGHGAALACGACHLMSGLGHPESAGLTGLTAAYIMQQMADFKSGVRVDSSRMNAISAEVSDEESRQAAEWFATLPRRAFTRVIEADMVPRTFVGQGRMRFLQPEGGTEPIGNRIITVPEDQGKARLRDPRTGFVAYVPTGSIARGRTLAGSGGSGRTVACSICHGDQMQGLGNVPRLAGLHPIYIARQLYLFKDGTRNGVDAQLMKRAVAQLTDEDIVNLAAYMSSLAP